ncbi:bem46 [Candida pseudojiufengensis]|uniref:bem46 n=1 Tax=Candida pseudojiufengensis TaxID=497109 RepID=UPI0022242474|nr:bem46 [Candida pseudojiufengensis]KAI5961843.1 bem46 [Candida pseudojiufengensis]
MLGSLYKLAKTLAQFGLGIAALALSALYFYQNTIIYPASVNDGHGYCATPDEYDIPYELVQLKTPDGETLQCYSMKQDSKDPSYTNKTILILSPNAGNIGHGLPIASIFYKQFGYNVFIYSYRGYGKSTGSPNEIGLKKDADTVMDHLTSDSQYQQSSIILYGRSLGGAVSIYIAATKSSSIHAIILENTFLSIRKTIPHIFPILKYAAGFVHQKWESELLVINIPSSIPVLLLSARKDEIVPPSHMDEIYNLLQSDYKQMYKFENSSHNDTVLQATYWDKIHQFIRDKVNPVGL